MAEAAEAEAGLMVDLGSWTGLNSKDLCRLETAEMISFKLDCKR